MHHEIAVAVDLKGAQMQNVRGILSAPRAPEKGIDLTDEHGYRNRLAYVYIRPHIQPLDVILIFGAGPSA